MLYLYSTLVQLDDSNITWSIFIVRNNEINFLKEKLSLTEKTIRRVGSAWPYVPYICDYISVTKINIQFLLNERYNEVRPFSLK